MRLIIRLAVLALVSSLAGETASRAEAPRPWRLIRLYRGTDAGPAGTVALRPISASACQSSGFDPSPPQEANALKFLRMQAAKAGAEAVVRVSCGSAAVKGCLLAVTCTGVAVRFPKVASTSK
jgi:hypothetical protein